MSITSLAKGCTLALVPLEAYAHVIPYVYSYVDDAIAYDSGRYTTEDAFGVLSKGGHLWTVFDPAEKKFMAGIITEFVEYPQAKALAIRVCGGRQVRRWLPLLSEIEAFADREGCAFVEFWGRKGWAKNLPDYRIRHIFYEKVLKSNEHRAERKFVEVEND